ncbi:MAG: stage V sporulation protein AB [Butyribacter sp.]|nr:stage V sporulation protein AB [bacterium]MDY3853802.1 stage V sporulation protein AB [Butyribacter sp.]
MSGWLQNIVLAFIGFAGGISVAGGVFAFISILGIVPRMADRLGIASHIYQMETLIAVGGVTGCIISVFEVPFAVGITGMILIGFFAGIFVGTLAMALAETLKVIPVLCQRTSLRMGLPVIITAMALGKALGSLYQLCFCAGR